MERGREVKRGGGNGPVSAPRRARTSGGFKDITGAEEDDLMDDVHNSRLRERLKKDTSSLFSLKRVISASGVSHSRTKRKRQDLQIQVRSSLMDEGDDATDDTDVGLSEDDDDPPPPTIPRWPGKPKLQTRQLDVEGIAVDLLAVPRKARSATVKRPHELSSHNAEVGASNPSPAPSSPRQTSPSNVLSSSSNIATKKTKQSGSKSRSSKMLKTVNLLSDNEVEVAEALSDFARLMVNQAHPPIYDASLEIKPNHLKTEHSNAASGKPAAFSESVLTSLPFVETIDGEPATSSSPLQASGLVIRASSPVVCPVQPALVSGEVTAPKRKRPRVRPRMEDGDYNLPMRTLVNARVVEAVNAGSPFLSKEPDQNVSVAETPVASGSKTSSVNALLSVSETPHNTDISHSPRENERLSDECQLVDAKALVTENIAVKLETSSDDDKQKVEALDFCKENGVIENSATAHVPDREADTVENSSRVLDESILSAETREPSKTPPASDVIPPVNVEINLMASPSAHSIIPKEQPSVVSTPEEFAAQDIGNVEVATPVKMSWLEKEQERLKENNLEKSTEILSEVQEQEPALNEGTPSGSFCRKKKLEVLNNEDNMNKQAFRSDIDSTPKLPWESINMEKAADRPASSAMPSALSSVSENASKLAFSTSSNAATVPEAFSLAGWAQGLPPIGPVGYYGSAAAAAAAMVAAAWSGVSSLAGPSMSDEKSASSVQLPPFLMKPPQARKRCSTHVYIAHLIALQQSIARHSFFSNPFGSSSTSYRTSAHTLNPLFPPFEAILNRNAEVFSGSGASSGNAVASAGLSVRGAGRTPEPAASPFSFEPSEKERETTLVADSVSKRQSTAPQLFSAQLPSTTLQAGLPILFPPSVATAGVGSGINGSAHGLGSSTNLMANGNFFNAMNRDGVIQQNNLTFSFPPPHLASLAFGGTPYLGGQQAAQYFGNPYYSMHLVHPPPQQAQSLPDIVAGLTQKQSQAQGVRSFLNSGNNQHQQPSPQRQQPSPSPQPQSPTKSPQRLHQEENNLEFDDGSGKRGFPPQHRNLQGQQTNSLSSNQSSYPNSFLGTGLQVLSGHIQDFDFMTQLSGKQATKTPQHKASARSQIQHQSSPSPKQQQQQSAVVQQQHGAGSAMSMNLKEIEAQASQLFGNISYRLSTTQGLEALAMNNMGRAAGSNLQPYSKTSDMKGSKTYDPGSISKASAGPGPLGLAPVAAVMAPQGHAVFQNMMDLARNYSQHQARESSSHSIPQTQPQQQQQQQHRSLQLERAVARGEEVHMLLDGNNAFGDVGTGREIFEDRNLALKRAATVSSRADFDTLSNTQGSPQSVNGGGSTLSALGHSTPTLSSRPITVVSGSAPVGAQPANHQSKQAGLRSKVTVASGTATIPMSSHSFPTYSDRIFAGVSSSKLQVQGSNPGQIIPSIQSARQVQAFANTQSKGSQKPSLGSTAPGPQSHPLLASAMSKTQGQQQLRNLPGPASTSTASRIPSSVSTASASPPALSHQSPAASKSSGKAASTAKGSGSLPQKSLGGNSGKKSNAMPTQIGAGQTVQTLPSKSSHQQHQQLSPSLQHFSSLPSAQQQQSYSITHQSSLNSTQQQQTAKATLQNRQQFQMRHHASIQQQQLLHSHAQQQALLQQSSVQQQSDVASQPQQPPSLHSRASHHLLLQQQPQSSQQTTLPHLQSLSAPAAPNSDGVSQALMMGAQAAAHGASYARINSDGTSLNQVATARSSPRSTARSLTSFNQGNAASHRSLGTGPSSIHSQLGLNGTSMGQPQAMNPLFHAVAGVYTPANANQGTAKFSGQKNSSEGSGLDQTNATSAPKSSQNPTGSHHGHDGKQQAADSYSGKVG